MWAVLFSTDAISDIQNLLKQNLLSEADREIIATWIKQIRAFGPESLSHGVNLWHDHELFGKWAGYRSSSFSFKGRLIYKVERTKVIVLVVKLTATHDYSRRK